MYEVAFALFVAVGLFFILRPAFTAQQDEYEPVERSLVEEGWSWTGTDPMHETVSVSTFNTWLAGFRNTVYLDGKPVKLGEAPTVHFKHVDYGNAVTLM